MGICLSGRDVTWRLLLVGGVEPPYPFPGVNAPGGHSMAVDSSVLLIVRPV